MNIDTAFNKSRSECEMALRKAAAHIKACGYRDKTAHGLIAWIMLGIAAKHLSNLRTSDQERCDAIDRVISSVEKLNRSMGMKKGATAKDFLREWLETDHALAAETNQNLDGDD